VDISRGGAAISANFRMRIAGSHLLVSSGGFSSWFPCSVVGLGAPQSGVAGHLAFGPLDQRQTALLERVLDSCRGDWDGLAETLNRR
jgi:hypothetical protein